MHEKSNFIFVYFLPSIAIFHFRDILHVLDFMDE